MTNHSHYLLLITLLVLLSSCASTKKMVYIQGATELSENPQRLSDKYEFRIKPDDRLEIRINSKEADLLTPFANSQTLGNSNQNLRDNSITGLLVDKNGIIEIPILGKFQAAGLTRQELANEIKRKLIEDEYIKSPTVIVRFQNSRITILGEVANPGVKEIINERITLLEAIGMAGDLLASARRDNILVVREENGERKSYTVDLTSSDSVFNSPVYYLQQNDMIYVQPNKSINVRGSAGMNYLSATGTIVGTLASILSLIFILTK